VQPPEKGAPCLLVLSVPSHPSLVADTCTLQLLQVAKHPLMHGEGASKGSLECGLGGTQAHFFFSPVAVACGRAIAFLPPIRPHIPAPTLEAARAHCGHQPAQGALEDDIFGGHVEGVRLQQHGHGSVGEGQEAGAREDGGRGGRELVWAVRHHGSAPVARLRGVVGAVVGARLALQEWSVRFPHKVAGGRANASERAMATKVVREGEDFEGVFSAEGGPQTRDPFRAEGHQLANVELVCDAQELKHGVQVLQQALGYRAVVDEVQSL